MRKHDEDFQVFAARVRAERENHRKLTEICSSFLNMLISQGLTEHPMLTKTLGEVSIAKGYTMNCVRHSLKFRRGHE